MYQIFGKIFEFIIETKTFLSFLTYIFYIQYTVCMCIENLFYTYFVVNSKCLLATKG